MDQKKKQQKYSQVLVTDRFPVYLMPVRDSEKQKERKSYDATPPQFMLLRWRKNVVNLEREKKMLTLPTIESEAFLKVLAAYKYVVLLFFNVLGLRIDT